MTPVACRSDSMPHQQIPITCQSSRLHIFLLLCALCVCVLWQLVKRDCQLDAALLSCGKLREGLESFRDWLVDVEARQSKQKPFSVDHKALKPQQQLQEVHSMVSLSLSAVTVLFIPMTPESLGTDVMKEF